MARTCKRIGLWYCSTLIPLSMYGGYIVSLGALDIHMFMIDKLESLEYANKEILLAIGEAE